MLGYGSGSNVLEKEDGLSVKSQNEEYSLSPLFSSSDMPPNTVEETDGVSPLPTGNEQVRVFPFVSRRPEMTTRTPSST